jgi:hypothetical protein
MINRKLILIVVGIAIVAVLGALVGNIGIRRVQFGSNALLGVSDPVLPGVATVVHWTPAGNAVVPTITLKVRDRRFETVMGSAPFSDQAAAVIFPCDLEGDNASLIMVDATTGLLINWAEVAMLPPGPDCLR